MHKVLGGQEVLNFMSALLLLNGFHLSGPCPQRAADLLGTQSRQQLEAFSVELCWRQRLNAAGARGGMLGELLCK